MANLSQSSQELVKTGLPYADLDGAKKQLQGLFPACPPAARAAARQAAEQ